MNIKVKITPYENGNVVAMATLTLESCFVVTGIRIMNGKSGLFVSMPSRKNAKTDEWEDICFPITKEFRQQIISAILEAFQNRDGDAKEEPTPPKKQIASEYTEEELPF